MPSVKYYEYTNTSDLPAVDPSQQSSLVLTRLHHNHTLRLDIEQKKKTQSLIMLNSQHQALLQVLNKSNIETFCRKNIRCGLVNYLRPLRRIVRFFVRLLIKVANVVYQKWLLDSPTIIGIDCSLVFPAPCDMHLLITTEAIIRHIMGI